MQELGRNNFASGEQQQGRKLPPILVPAPAQQPRLLRHRDYGPYREPVGTHSTAPIRPTGSLGPEIGLKTVKSGNELPALRMQHCNYRISLTNLATSLLLGETYTYENY